MAEQITSPPLDRARLKALAEKAKGINVRVCSCDDCESYRDTLTPDVILSLLATLEKIERQAVMRAETYPDPDDGGYVAAWAEVLRLLREEAKP
jgi:hypothetical protein